MQRDSSVTRTPRMLEPFLIAGSRNIILHACAWINISTFRAITFISFKFISIFVSFSFFNALLTFVRGIHSRYSSSSHTLLCKASNCTTFTSCCVFPTHKHVQGIPLQLLKLGIYTMPMEYIPRRFNPTVTMIVA